MTLLLLFGGGSGVVVPAGDGVAGPGGSMIHVEFSPTTDPYDDPVWVDVSEWVRFEPGISITRGRSNELDDFQTGSCSFSLDNRTLAFDNAYAGSPYVGLLEPGRYWRVFIVYEGVTYQRFHGFSQGFPQSFHISKRDAVVPMVLYDAFSAFAQSELGIGGWVVGTSAAGTGRVGGGVAGTLEPSGERIDTVLDLEGWPASRTVLDVGQSNIATGEPTGDPLSYLKEIEESEDGFLYVDRDGRVTFLDRHQRYTLDRMTTSQATFSDQGDDLGYATFGIDPGFDRVFNDWRITRDDGEEQVAEDSASIRRYRRRKGPTSSVLLTTDTEVRNLAHSLLNRSKDPHDRLPSIELRPMRDPAVGLPAWLDRELLDCCNVEHDPLNVGDLRTFDVLLEGYTESFNSVDFQVSASFSPRITRSPFIVGDPVAGVVGDREIVH